MKKLKKCTALLLSVLFVFGLAAVSFAALKGDADGDGTVSPGDARLILRFSIGLDLIDPAYVEGCDIDGDGAITPGDARMALRLALGLPADGPSNVGENTKTVPTKDAFIKSLADAVSYDELNDNVKIFTNNIGSRWYTLEGIDLGRGYVEGILRYNGFAEKEIVRDKFYCNDVPVYNVYTKIPTAVKNPDIILFCAHYDSYHKGNGAVDNASGLCTVLEISRILKSMNKDFGVEIRFAFFACEELGYYGAHRYIDSYAAGDLARHAAVFNVDMSGHFTEETSDENLYLCVSTKSAYGSNAKSNTPSLAVDAAKKVLGSCGEYKYMSPVAAGLHDLIPFEDEGTPAVTLSWREINADESYGSDYNLAAPYYIHTDSDVYKNLDMQSVYLTTRLASGAAAAALYDYVY